MAVKKIIRILILSWVKKNVRTDPAILSSAFVLLLLSDVWGQFYKTKSKKYCDFIPIYFHMGIGDIHSDHNKKYKVLYKLHCSELVVFGCTQLCLYYACLYFV